MDIRHPEHIIGCQQGLSQCPVTIDPETMYTQFCKRELPDLIRVAGTPQFLSSIMGATSQCLAHVDVCAIFYYDEAARPVGYATASRYLEEVTRKSAERYVEFLGMHDPIRRLLLDNGTWEDPVALQVGIEDIDHPAYREMNFVRTRTIDRISIVFKNGAMGLAVNFYRKAESGRFLHGERTALFELAPLFSSLVQKHVILSGQSAPPLPESLESRIGRALLQRSALLSDRECEICTLIVLGHTTEAIALKLGISANTILTYRKRAYAKLQIGTQNELFRICLDCV